MSNQQLQSAMHDTEWEYAAREMQSWGWELEAQSTYYAELLVSRVLSGVCAVADLRQGVAWVNALDAEAVIQGVAIETKDRGGVEALARRIAHHAGRSALREVGTTTKLEAARARHTTSAGYLLEA